MSRSEPWSRQHSTPRTIPPDKRHRGLAAASVMPSPLIQIPRLLPYPRTRPRRLPPIRVGEPPSHRRSAPGEERNHQATPGMVLPAGRLSRLAAGQLGPALLLRIQDPNLIAPADTGPRGDRPSCIAASWPHVGLSVVSSWLRSARHSWHPALALCQGIAARASRESTGSSCSGRTL